MLLCAAHQKRQELGQDMDRPIRKRNRNSHPSTCSVSGCINRAIGYGLCAGHKSKRRRVTDAGGNPEEDMSWKVALRKRSKINKVNIRDIRLMPVLAKAIEEFAEARAMSTRQAVEEIVAKWYGEQGKYHSLSTRQDSWSRSGDDNHDV
jgi:hypothetical protein